MDHSLKLCLVLLLHFGHTEGTAMISPPGVAPVCSGDPLELMCTTTVSFLEWRFNVIRGNETTATEFSRVIPASVSASDAMSQLIVNSITFSFSRTSAKDSLPLISRLLISPVSSSLNGTVMNCVDVDTSEVSSTTVIIRESDSLQGLNVTEQPTELEDDGVTVMLEWNEVSPMYSVNVTVVPETQVNISGSTARLMVAYNTMYNVSVLVSHLCRQGFVTVFTKVYYYPRTSAPANTCRNPEAQITDSVIVSGYTDPAVEGTTVIFHCPPGLVLKGSNSSVCMENGEWVPALDEMNCSEGSFSGLSQEAKIAVATSVSMLVVASALFFTFGFLSGYICHKRRKVDETGAHDHKTQCSPYYDDVVLKQEQELELKENTVYGLMQ